MWLTLLHVHAQRESLAASAAVMRNTTEGLRRAGSGLDAAMISTLASAFPKRLWTQENVEENLEAPLVLR